MEINDNANTTTQNIWEFSKSSAKRKVHSNTTYLKKQEKNKINILALHQKQLEKEEMKNPRGSRRKEVIKIRTEINKKEKRR